MLKDLKVGSKILGGFIIVALITLIVGFIGWYGSDTLGDDIHEISDVRLPSIQSLLEVDVALDQTETALRTLLNTKLLQRERREQFIDVESNIKDMNESIAIYEPLPQTKEESALWKQFVPALEDWRKDTAIFLNMMRELETIDILDPDALRANIEMFQGDHYRLMAETSELVLRGRRFEGGDDATACRFGRWMGTFQTSNPVIENAIKEIIPFHNGFHESVKTIKQHVDAGRGEAALKLYSDQMVPSAAGTFKYFEEIIKEIERVEEIYKSANELAMGTLTEKQHSVEGLLERIIDINNQEAEKATLHADENVALTKTIAIIGMILGTLLAIIIGITLTGMITKPMFKGVEFAKLVAKGDLTVDLEVDQKDEIGQLATALKDMVANLRNIMKNLTATTNNLSSSSEELSSVSTQMASGAEEMNSQSSTVASAAEQINASVGTVASAAEQSSSSVTNIASMTEELSSTFSNVANNARKTSGNVTQMAKAGEEMSTGINSIAAAVEEMTSSLNEVAKNTGQASRVSRSASERTVDINEKMNALVNASKQIGKVVGVIKDIADQTNMLALNATIEAAGAGEAGKGFAVVAGEVKELAKQSAEATDEIAGQIDQIQSSTNEAVKAIEEINKTIEEIAGINETIASAVEEQTATAREISRSVASNASTVKEVAGSASESANLVEDIAKSIDETAKTAKEIARHIDELSGGIRDVAKSSGEASRGVQEVSKNIQGINTAAKQTAVGASQTQESSKELAKMATELAEIVKGFKI